MLETNLGGQDRQKTFLNRAVLISPPWPVFSLPSIQLGALKAYLKKEFPDFEVVCSHFFLQLAPIVGYRVYKAVSERVWMAECVYAAMLYPGRIDEIQGLFQKTAKKYKVDRDLDFRDIVRRAESASEEFIGKTDWSSFDLAGFSVCLCQLTSSLYLIRRIKETAPDLPVIAGGSTIGAASAGGWLKAFPEIDIIVSGEGEIPLSRIVGHLKAGGKITDFPGCPGVESRHQPGGGSPGGFSQVRDLSDLPEPDFSEYFSLLSRFPEDKRFFPTLPAEVSRGCWWRAVHPGSGERGCAFCNLNLQWSGYRQKPALKAAREVSRMAERHKLLSVEFMDNSLPPGRSRMLFRDLASGKKDFRFFSELRASTDRETLRLFSEAGMTEVQIGIEALSSRLLKKLNKGTSAIQNLEIMKNCEEFGIRHNSNLILHFPGSDEEDAEETLRAIDFASVFYPLRIVHFWLGIHSPVWRNPGFFGIKAVFNHPNYRVLFPDSVCRNVRFMIQDYRGDKKCQKRLWQPVARAVKEWRKNYFDLHSCPGAGPVLSYRDGGGFLVIRRRRAGREPENHRLTGGSRRIYLFCGKRRRFNEIVQCFPEFSADRIRSFLGMMYDKRLLFEDDGEYLSLAVPERQSFRHPSSSA